MSAILPIPKQPMSVRVATLDDLPFIDGLQKAHSRQVGWMPEAQLQGKVRSGDVLVAERPDCLVPLGYVIGRDQYFKRDDVGIIYQMNVAPEAQRGLIGATLLKAMFDRAAYGCRLFCCWCAQDLEANRFWEAMGFVPLAFRAGSRDKGRVHIFWQRRIRAGDTTTPYWFPAQTSAGSMREDRLVLPIPPGVRWDDEMPRLLPSEQRSEVRDQRSERKMLGMGGGRSRRLTSDVRPPLSCIASGGLRFGPMPAAGNPAATDAAKPKRAKVKNDPKLVAAARELRDRWLEEVNAGRYLPAAEGKYDVGRALPAVQPPASLHIAAGPVRLLGKAA